MAMFEGLSCHKINIFTLIGCLRNASSGDGTALLLAIYL